MQTLLIGNGYDLNLNLPTGYIDFLRTADFILKNNTRKYWTIGKIFSNKYFDDVANVRKAYKEYHEIYDSIELDPDAGTAILEYLDGNVWFEYFLTSFNKQIGWIDFEKEIGVVITCFERLFKINSKKIRSNGHDITSQEIFILRKFMIFENDSGEPFHEYIKDDFLIEYPINSKNLIINKDRVTEYLLENLKKLSFALSLYMKCFVDVIIDKKVIDESKYNLFCADVAITLNYTHTYEKLNGVIEKAEFTGKGCFPCAFHVHGSDDEKIVLGVNPDSSDIGEYVDSTFAPFKKYFQRVVYRTDKEYIRFIKYLDKEKPDMNLFVMGHSLDVTDRDIIETLFERAKTITIYCHSERAMGNLIKNVIALFGVNTFNDYRLMKDLKFILQNDIEGIKENLTFQGFEEGFNTDLVCVY